jgi:hypothetical protein
LPKVLSSYPLSPQWEERVRVRGEKNKLLATSKKRGETTRNCRESPPLKKGDLRTSKGKEFMANAINCFLIATRYEKLKIKSPANDSRDTKKEGVSHNG